MHRTNGLGLVSVVSVMESLSKVGLVLSRRIHWYSVDMSSAMVVTKLSLMSLPRF